MEKRSTRELIEELLIYDKLNFNDRDIVDAILQNDTELREQIAELEAEVGRKDIDRLKDYESEVKELQRENEILKMALYRACLTGAFEQSTRNEDLHRSGNDIYVKSLKNMQSEAFSKLTVEDLKQMDITEIWDLEAESIIDEQEGDDGTS